MTPPKRLPEIGPWASLFRWLNQLRDFCVASQVRPGVGTRITRNSSGTTVEAGGSVRKPDVGGKAYWL